MAVRSAPHQWSFELTTVAWSSTNHGDVNLGEVREGVGLEDSRAPTARCDSSSHIETRPEVIGFFCDHLTAILTCDYVLE